MALLRPVLRRHDSKFKTDVYRLSVGYEFVDTDRAKLGLAIGAHVTKITAAITGNATVGGGAAQLETRRTKILAPLPTVGLFGSFEIAPRLTLSGRADYLSLKVGDYDGKLLNLEGRVAYRFLPNVGVGALYRFVDYRVGVEKKHWDGRFDYQFSGPSVFLEVGFK
jgi:hypothetical protein